MGRLLILYKFGGIYIDIDQKCYKSFKDFGINKNTKLVLCKSVETDRVCNGFVNNYWLFIATFIGIFIRSFLKILTYKIARGQN